MQHKIVILFLLLSSFSFSQKKVFNREFSIPEKTPLLLSYYGNIGIHPGLKVGFEYSLFLKEKTKEKKKKIKTIRKTLILAPSIAFYNHKNSHQGLLISADMIWRRYTKRLYISDVSFGLGYYNKFNSGSTYEVTPDGVEEIGTASRGYFTPTIGYSFGKRFMIKETIPSEVFTRINAHILLGQNSSPGTELSLELGMRLSLKYGINQSKTKNKLK